MIVVPLSVINIIFSSKQASDAAHSKSEEARLALEMHVADLSAEVAHPTIVGPGSILLRNRGVGEVLGCAGL